MAEWSKAPDSSSGPLTRAWVQTPLLTKLILCTKFIHNMIIFPRVLNEKATKSSKIQFNVSARKCIETTKQHLKGNG